MIKSPLIARRKRSSILCLELLIILLGIYRSNIYISEIDDFIKRMSTIQDINFLKKLGVINATDTVE